MKRKDKLSVFIPVYNEEKILKENIERLYKELTILKYPFEIFIIDDNSLDKTKKIGKRLEKKLREVKYIHYSNGPSRRENLSESFKLANGRIIIFMDCDLSTNLYYLSELIGAIEEGYDISIGSRHLKNSIVKRSLKRKIGSKIGKIFIKWFFDSKIEDHECGFKAFKRNRLLELTKEMGYDKTLKRKMFWDAELLIRAQRKKYKIKEFPVKWSAGKKSELRFWKEITSLFYLVKFKRKLIK